MCAKIKGPGLVWPPSSLQDKGRGPGWQAAVDGWKAELGASPAQPGLGHSLAPCRALGAPRRQDFGTMHLPGWPGRAGSSLPGQEFCVCRLLPNATSSVFLFLGLKLCFEPRWVGPGQCQTLLGYTPPTPCRAHSEGGLGIRFSSRFIMEPGRKTSQKTISKNSRQRAGTVCRAAGCRPSGQGTDRPGDPRVLGMATGSLDQTFWGHVHQLVSLRAVVSEAPASHGIYPSPWPVPALIPTRHLGGQPQGPLPGSGHRVSLPVPPGGKDSFGTGILKTQERLLTEEHLLSWAGFREKAPSRAHVGSQNFFRTQNPSL